MAALGSTARNGAPAPLNGSPEKSHDEDQHRREGDLGPVYGFQWRHFGARYTDCDADYSGQGVDQLAECIRKIREDPTDRRIILSAWNPADAPDAPRRLSCLLYQRSADLGLGIPFNIASYALLTHLVAHLTQTEPHELIIQLGDAHVYRDHVDALKEQLERTPRPFPTLRWNRRVEDVDDFKAEDIAVEGYQPYPPIAMKMSV
ncbi:predicted protein [Postia placenta Mad-698-R]|nr:predicted protein [Postia placenta Mad-698-R]